MYHAITEERSAIAVSPAAFARQMQALHDGGYNVIALTDLVRCLQAGEPLPPRSIVITFDDGFESVYRVAFPTLARFGFPATVFLVSGHCGKDNNWPGQPAGVPIYPLMSWEQARELDRHGIEIGAHTVSHPRLDQLETDQVLTELTQSKEEIEGQIGRAVGQFAYPYGRFHDSIRRAVASLFDGACGTRPALVRRGGDRYAIERIDAQYVTNPLLLRRIGEPTGRAYLGLRRTVRSAASMLLRRTWS